MKIVGEQLAAVKSALSTSDWANVSIAYEPCWAIGTGLAATPEMAQDTHNEIRAWVAKNVSADVAEKVRIQYGGSMKAANAKLLLCQPDIDGGLIGGASLKVRLSEGCMLPNCMTNHPSLSRTSRPPPPAYSPSFSTA